MGKNNNYRRKKKSILIVSSVIVTFAVVGVVVAGVLKLKNRVVESNNVNSGAMSGPQSGQLSEGGNGDSQGQSPDAIKNGDTSADNTQDGSKTPSGDSDMTATTDSSGLYEKVVIDGKEYTKKKNIKTYLFMGIDSKDGVPEVTEYGDARQCDMLMLLVRDLSEGTFKTMAINRNTIVEMDYVDVDGTVLSSGEMQIAIAHAGGDGREISCENVVKTVSDYLGGQDIDGYASLSMGAIPMLNNLAGGVTVTIEDDFSGVDPSLVMGQTILLNDSQAMNFVHSRMEMADDSTNENRMKRQSQYLAGLKDSMYKKISQNKSYPFTVYDALQEYMVTNISKQTFSKIATLMLNERDAGEVVIDGVVGEDVYGYATFEPDEKSLNKAIIELFYYDE